MSISRKLQEVLKDNFGIDIDDDFNSDAPYFSVSYWENGQILESHNDIVSVRNLIAEKYQRGDDDGFKISIYDCEGNKLEPDFSNITFKKVKW